MSLIYAHGCQARVISKEPSRLLDALLFERKLFATAITERAAFPSGAPSGAGDEISLAPVAQAAFRDLCISVVKVFVGIVENALQTVTGEKKGGRGEGPGGLEAEWGAAASMARRFVSCLDLLHMLDGLREALPALAGG